MGSDPFDLESLRLKPEDLARMQTRLPHMTYRLWVAGMVMSGIAARVHPWTQQEAASIAVSWADALIARLAEPVSEQVAPGAIDPRD